MKTPNQGQFKLTKSTLMKGGGMIVEYVLTDDKGAEVHIDDFKIKCTKEPHPDFTTGILSLKHHLMHVFGMHLPTAEFLDKAIKSDEKSALKKLQGYLDDIYRSQKDKIKIEGVAIAGNEDSRSCEISALYFTEAGGKVKFDSKKIKLKESIYGFEEELAKVLDKIEEEAYLYLYKDKQAQLTLFNSPEEEVEEEEVEEEQEA